MKPWRRDEVDRALAGEPGISREFAESVIQRVHLEVGFTLRQLTRTSIKDLLEHRDDLIQTCLLYLYEDSAKVLKTWDADAGMTLSSFIGLVVRRRIYRVFRYKRSNPAAAASLPPEDIERLLESAPDATGSLENELMSALALSSVRKCVDAGDLSDRDRRIYRAFYVDERDSVDICSAEGVSPDGLHQALKRMRDRLKRCLERHGPLRVRTSTSAGRT
jgi:RNA polymerase sigma factor (sigma-70 family)